MIELLEGLIAGLGWLALVYFLLLAALYVGFTLIAGHSIVHARRSRSYMGLDEIFSSPLTPGVSILLPAYNEQEGIVESVRSLLRLRYPRLEVVVVNDGSNDDTLRVLAQAYQLEPLPLALRDRLSCQPVLASYVSRRHPNLVVLDKLNGGKADALNAALNAARYPYVCAIDADAMLEEDALLHVIKPVVDDPEQVVATGGTVRIVNGCRVEHGRVVQVSLPASRVATLQVLEYLRAFLVGRVGWSRLGALLIISGAFGLFRRSAVEEAGGWWTGTVGEDVELVMRLHRMMRERGESYRIEFTPDPVCWTECPEDLRTLSRQRRRWQRGLVEGLWRHRRVMGNPRYGLLGLVAFPYFLAFELLGPLLAVLSFLVLPLAALLGLLDLSFLVAFLLLALLSGFMLSMGALLLEEIGFGTHPRAREVWRMVGLMLVENFGYRQLTDFWRAWALIDLVRKRHAWGEMRRKGLVRPELSPEAAADPPLSTKGS